MVPSSLLNGSTGTLPLIFHAHKPPRTWNRQSPSIQLHARNSTVLRAFLTNTLIPCPQRSQWLLPTDLVFHRTLPQPPRPQASLLPPHGRTGEHSRCNTCPPLRTPIARVVDAHVFHEGEPHQRHDCPFWRTSVSLHGPVQGRVHAAPFGRMRKHPGDVEAVPN